MPNAKTDRGHRKSAYVAYRGYDLELTRAVSGWLVGMYPRSADLPILSRNSFFARDENRAVAQAKSE
jgi:hypothetical protein